MKNLELFFCISLGFCIGILLKLPCLIWQNNYSFKNIHGYLGYLPESRKDLIFVTGIVIPVCLIASMLPFMATEVKSAYYVEKRNTTLCTQFSGEEPIYFLNIKKTGIIPEMNYRITDQTQLESFFRGDFWDNNTMIVTDTTYPYWFGDTTSQVDVKIAAK